MKKLIILLMLSGLAVSGAFAQSSSRDTLIKKGKIIVVTFLQRIDSTKALFQSNGTIIELSCKKLANSENKKSVYVREVISYVSFHDSIIETRDYVFLAIKKNVSPATTSGANDFYMWLQKEKMKEQVALRQGVCPTCSQSVRPTYVPYCPGNRIAVP